MITIPKEEFVSCAKRFIEDPTLQKIETHEFVFIRPNGVITVKFKQFKGLSGYFTMEEFNNEETLMTILKTLETEMNKRETSENTK
jgi:hypothetical protein